MWAERFGPRENTAPHVAAAGPTSDRAVRSFFPAKFGRRRSPASSTTTGVPEVCAMPCSPISLSPKCNVATSSAATDFAFGCDSPGIVSGFSKYGVRHARSTLMSDHGKQLWEDLNDLLQGLDWRFSGPEEAALGSYGRRLVRTILQVEMLCEDECPRVYCESLWAGFESLVSDYRISKQSLDGMKLAYFQLRRGAAANAGPGSSGGEELNRFPKY